MKFCPGEEMATDPVCGMFVPEDTDLTSVVDGQTYYFCSKTCQHKEGNILVCLSKEEASWNQVVYDYDWYRDAPPKSKSSF